MPSDYSNPLTDGLKVITATITDAASNISASADAFYFTLDTKPPTHKVVLVDYVDAVGPIQGPKLSGAQTDDPQPTLRGTFVDKDGQPIQLPADERVSTNILFLTEQQMQISIQIVII